MDGCRNDNTSVGSISLNLLHGEFFDTQGSSRNSKRPPCNPSCNQRSAVSFKTGRPLRNVTSYFGKAWGSSGMSEAWIRPAAACAE